MRNVIILNQNKSNFFFSSFFSISNNIIANLWTVRTIYWLTTTKFYCFYILFLLFVVHSYMLDAWRNSVLHSNAHLFFSVLFYFWFLVHNLNCTHFVCDFCCRCCFIFVADIFEMRCDECSAHDHVSNH